MEITNENYVYVEIIGYDEKILVKKSSLHISTYFLNMLDINSDIHKMTTQKSLDFVEDKMSGNENNEELLNLPICSSDITPDIFEYIKEFMEHYELEPLMTIPKPLRKDLFFHLNEMNNNFYIQFLQKIPNEDLYKVMMGSYFLYITPLFELCSARYADLLRDIKNPQDIQTLFTS